MNIFWVETPIGSSPSVFFQYDCYQHVRGLIMPTSTKGNQIDSRMPLVVLKKSNGFLETKKTPVFFMVSEALDRKVVLCPKRPRVRVMGLDLGIELEQAPLSRQRTTFLSQLVVITEGSYEN